MELSFISIFLLTLYHQLNCAESIVIALAEFMVDKKENMDANLLSSFRSGNPVYICRTLSCFA